MVRHMGSELAHSNILNDSGAIDSDSVETSFARTFEESIMMYEGLSGTEVF